MTHDRTKVEAGWKERNFAQSVPIPSYLLALVCGHLEPRVISDRVSVYAEPCVVQEAADEFQVKYSKQIGF